MALTTGTDEQGETMAEKTRKLQLKVGFEGKPDPDLEVSAFVFDGAGQLVTSAPVRRGAADLVLPDDLSRPQVLIAPSEVAEDGPPSLDRLHRIGAYEPAFRLAPGDKVVQLQPILPSLLWCKCRVRGRVVRPVEFASGVQDMPVCHAIVHICEVDRWPLVIAKLPDHLVRRLQEEILVGPPIPEPDPGPFARVRSRARVSRLDRVALNPQPLPPKALSASLVARQPIEVSPSVKAVLSAESLVGVRRGLVDNATLFLPYLCLWDWLWPWFTCDEVAVVTTDENGRFDTSFGYACFFDRPDVYVWVEYPVAGTPTTVYRPSIACNTYWDYACGSELTIRVTDPRVPWCGGTERPPGSKVVIVSIGAELGFPEIQAESAGGSAGLTVDGSPLGGSLEPAVLFGTTLPAGVTHYRWSYRQISRSDATPVPANPPWNAIVEPVGRHYEVGGMPGWYSLVPVPALGGVFEIQPQNPPGGPTSVWRPSLGVRVNNATAFFTSETRGAPGPAAGAYELKLELFRIVAGVPVRVRLDQPGALIALEVVAEPVPLGPSPLPYVPAPVANHLIEAGQLVGFRWLIHIDDNECVSDIVDVTVGPNAAGPCGFIQYDPAAAPPAEATIAFRAHHPNGFATFSFVVSKGSSGPVAEATASGPVTDPAPNGFVNDGAGNFTKNVPVATLLDGCVEAAFAETNYVAALATDGWNPLGQYDASGPTKAFALEPQDPPA
ncbi:MAG: hypothetical protein ACRD1K_14920 [Acidimicrobiales bacterium]